MFDLDYSGSTGLVPEFEASRELFGPLSFGTVVSGEPDFLPARWEEVPSSQEAVIDQRPNNEDLPDRMETQWTHTQEFGPQENSIRSIAAQRAVQEAQAEQRAVHLHNAHELQDTPIPTHMMSSTSTSLVGTPIPRQITRGEYSWLEDMMAAATPIEANVRIERRYAMLASRPAYDRRSTRGNGIERLGGEVALVTSLDEFCYVQAMEPGFVFTDLNKAHLYRRALSEATNKGYWVITRSGVVHFPAGNGTFYLADLARRACEGMAFRDRLESRNRTINRQAWIEDWRAYLINSRNVVDIGVFDRLALRLRWKLYSAFGVALSRPPRQ